MFATQTHPCSLAKNKLQILQSVWNPDVQTALQKNNLSLLGNFSKSAFHNTANKSFPLEVLIVHNWIAKNAFLSLLTLLSQRSQLRENVVRILVRAVGYTIHGLIPASCVFADRYNREEVGFVFWICLVTERQHTTMNLEEAETILIKALI